MDTLNVAIEQYLSEISLTRKASTANRSKQILMEYLPFANGDVRQSVLSYLGSCKQRGNDTHTLENKRIRLGAFYRWQGIKLTVPKFKIVVQRPEVYTQEELTAIFKAANDERDRMLYTTLLQAGLRMQEAMFLTHDNLLNEGIEVTAHDGWTPKDSEERIVRVPRQLTENLRRLTRIGDSKLVFPTAKGNVNFHMLRTLKRTAKRAGVKEAWLHKFRANFATQLLRAGISLQDTMYQLGHSNVKSTMRYMALLGGADLQAKIEAVWG
jgi:integrase